jgi:regulatory protein
LSGILTQFEFQKSNKTRLDLFVDDNYFMSISEHTFIKVNPKKGLPIEPILDMLEEEEQFNSCFSKALDFLSRRQHGTEELAQKLSLKEFSNDAIEKGLEKIKALGYLNDELFADSFVKDKQRLQRWGKVKIIAELQKKGIGFLPESYDDRLEIENACYLAAKKYKNITISDKNRIKKVEQNLFSKGYSFDSIAIAVSMLNDSY